VFRLVRIFREGKIFYVYMTKNGVSIRRFYSSLPIPAIKKKYDLVRDAQAKVIQRRRAEREEKEKNERERKPRDFGNIRFKRETLEKIRSICTENPHVTAKEICAHAGVSYQLMDRLVIEAGIQNINVGEGKKKKVWKVDTNWR
jgi:predicted HTH transcriptional regulator